jgi:glycosyltransferase involved in cell wall biosynthesis
MRILVGIPESGSRGGPAACEPPFIEELRRLGHNVEEEVYAYADAEAGLAKRVQRVMHTARRFRERVERGNFDLVHINTAFDTKALLRDAVVVPQLRSDSAKIFLKFHGSDARLLETKNPALTLMRHRLLLKVDGIGVLSNEERQNFLRAGVSEKKVFLVKNVVEPNVQRPDPELCKQLNLRPDVPLLLFIGRFIPAKGLLDTIRAAAMLRDHGKEFMLLCLGDGPARREAEAEVEHLNLQDHVRFFGYVPEEETAAFYANSTALIFPTYHGEGFPMVIFNAAAAGLPIITTRIRAAADYLSEPENCLWVAPRNPEQLAEKIGELLWKGELGTAMGANNKRLVKQFSAEIVAREYLEAYKSYSLRSNCGLSSSQTQDAKKET